MFFLFVWQEQVNGGDFLNLRSETTKSLAPAESDVLNNCTMEAATNGRPAAEHPRTTTMAQVEHVYMLCNLFAAVTTAARPLMEANLCEISCNSARLFWPSSAVVRRRLKTIWQ